MGMVALAGGAFGSVIVSPDEVYERAMRFFDGIGVSEGLAVRLRLKIADRVGISDAKSIEFELKRLSKTLVAVSAWARGVARNEQQAEPFLPRATWETMANSIVWYWILRARLSRSW